VQPRSYHKAPSIKYGGSNGITLPPHFEIGLARGWDRTAGFSEIVLYINPKTKLIISEIFHLLINLMKIHPKKWKNKYLMVGP